MNHKLRINDYGIWIFGIILYSLFLIPSSADAASVCTHYASPNGGGNGLSQSSPFQIADFWPVASPGKTLCLLDGVYTGDRSMIDPWNLGYGLLSGTSANPITVRALNDGAVTIDGQSARRPIRMNGNSWFVVEGLNAHNSDDGAVVAANNGAHDIIFRRIVAWDAGGTTNNQIWLLGGSADNLLCEDCVAFGKARKLFGTVSGSNVTCRRCWMELSFSPATEPKEGFELAYNNNNVTYENSIGTWNMQSGNTDQRQGIFSTGNTIGGGPWNNKVFGSIAYYLSNGTPPDALFDISENALLKDVVAYVKPGLTVPTFSLSNGAQMTNATSIGGAGITPSSSSNIESGSSVSSVSLIYSGTQGATVCNRYINGTLTSTPLWPWPMDQRIKDARSAAGYSSVTAGMANDDGNVTTVIENIFGAIPSVCRTGAVTTSTLSGDLNNDKIVNSLDWSLMSSKWLTSDATADLNKDGTVNTLDWSIMSGNWLKTIQ